MDEQCRIKSALQRLADFVQDYLPFANAHNTDFITHGLWDRLLPPQLAQELRRLDDATLVALPGAPTELTYKDAACGDGDAALPDIQISTYGETVLKDPLGRPEWDKTALPSWRHADLSSFLADAQSHTLEGLAILDPLEEVFKELAKPEYKEEDNVFVHSHMSTKKGHEVELMAHVCQLLAKQQGVDKVVDVGSGRGYLSCHLSQMYHLQVLGIDSSDINTHSAQDRSRTLQRHWKGLERNARRDKEHNKQRQTKREKLGNLDVDDNDDKIKSEIDTASVSVGCKQSEVKCTTNLHIPSSGSKQLTVDAVHDVCRQTTSVGYHRKGTYVPVTLFVKPDMDLNQLLQKHLTLNPGSCCDDSNCDREVLSDSGATAGPSPECPRLQPEGSCGRCHISDTRLENTDHNEPSLSACHNKASLSARDAEPPPTPTGHPPPTGHQTDFMLTGLHTCGGLAATMVQLYTHNPRVVALASVGCCYHFLEESYVANPFKIHDHIDEAEIAFPLSSVLQSRKFCLGRNARVLACQAVARLTDQATLPPESLFHRALLQLILRDITGETRLDWKVGRIAAKTKTFTDYVFKCLKKLMINHSLTEDDIAEYEHCYIGHLRRLRAFFQLKAVLAPCIEALVVLDRFLYLIEKNPVDKHHLIQIFNPVTSPRCYGILSLKATTS